MSVNTTKEMQLVNIDKLIPYANNARTHSKEQIEKLRRSIREFGFVNPVIIDKDFNIIAGHGRVLAGKKEGIKQVPCVLVDYLTEEQKRAYILADNRLALDAGWDEEMLRKELEGLSLKGFDLSLTGFEEEIDEIFEDGNQIIEDDFDLEKNLKKIDEPTCKHGDIFKLGNHRLMCGDSTNEQDVSTLMGGGTDRSSSH